MSLQEKVPIPNIRHTTINNCALLGTLGPVVDVAGVGRVEPSLMALHRDDERDPRLRLIHPLASRSNMGKFLSEHNHELALRDTITINQDVFG